MRKSLRSSEVSACEATMMSREFLHTIVLNIPHTSMEFPYKANWHGDIGTYIHKWTDNYTDALFHPDFRFSGQVIPVRYPYSRFFCDVERLESDPLEKIGQGIVYRQFKECSREVGYEERMMALQSYYQHQCRLLGAIPDKHTLLLDCHSFPSGLADVDICIGFNEDWSKPTESLLLLVKDFFEQRGAVVGISTPYSNAISPRKSFDYPCLMLEVNKRFYLGADRNPEGRLELRNSQINDLYGLLLNM